VKFLQYICSLLLLVFLLAACSGATPTTTQLPPLPTAKVPPLSDIDTAISKWEKSNTKNYYGEVQTITPDEQSMVRLVIADDQVRTAQKLERDAQGEWGEPVAMPLDEAESYRVSALLDKIRQDALGNGLVPYNLITVFDSSLGFPAVVHAEALPTYTQDGKLALNREYSYDQNVKVKALLEETFGVGKEPILILTRSGGPEAWCESLRIFEDGSSVYTDDCRDKVLQLDLPEKRLNSLEELRAEFGRLDLTREQDGGTEHLIIIGTGQGEPDQETQNLAWEVTGDSFAILSNPLGLGLTAMYVREGTLVGFDVFNKDSLPARVNNQGSIRSAAVDPDGKYLALSDDTGVIAIDLLNGQSKILLQAPEDGYYLLGNWAGTGQLVVTQVPGTDAGQVQNGWLSLDEPSWHDLPAPEEAIGYGCTTGMSWSPDSARLAITGLAYGTPCNTSPGLTVVELPGGNARRIIAPTIETGADGGETIIAGAFTPAWSPDGQWIAFGLDQEATGATNDPLSFPTRLYRVRPDGSDLTPLTNNSQGNAAYPAWAPDGTLYYSLNNDGVESNGIYRYDPKTNEHTLLIPGAKLHALSVSPDGHFLIYDEAGSLKLWSFLPEEVIPVAAGKEGAPVAFVGWLSVPDQP
jgi:WD40 repeat protein